MKLINLGKGHTIMANRIIGVFQFGSRATIRLRQVSEKLNKAVNLGNGEKIKSLVLADDGYLFLSAVKADTITQRIEKTDDSTTRACNV